MNLKYLRTNAAAETEGVWLEFMGAQFKLASAASPAYRAALTKHGRKHSPHEIRRNTELADTINREAMADAILLDWKGDVNDGDEALEAANREHRIRLLQVRPFAEWVASECQNIANFQTEGREDLESDLKSRRPLDP